MSWFKIKDAAKYAGVSSCTLRKWIRGGLRHSRLPSGMILIKQDPIDQFPEKYEVKENDIDKIVDEVMGRFLK